MSTKSFLPINIAAVNYWSLNLFLAVDCGRLQHPQNGDISYSSSTASGSTATYNCRQGYTLDGLKERTCQVTNAQWSGSASACQRKLYYIFSSNKILISFLDRTELSMTLYSIVVIVVVNHIHPLNCLLKTINCS